MPESKVPSDNQTQIDELLNHILTIPPDKNYWFIRTSSGMNYKTFRDNGFVGLDHSEVPLSKLSQYQKEFGTDKAKIYNAIKGQVIAAHELRATDNSKSALNARQAGLTASQINRFYSEIKKGDTIIIPSEGSDMISFGLATQSRLADFTEEDVARIGYTGILTRRVNWLKDVPRSKLEPNLFRMFTAHQAINDVKKYAEFVERSVHDFYILDEEAHLIINVETTNQISAADLFGFGSEILNIIDQVAKRFNLDAQSSDLQVSISLNSPGRIDLKSKIKSTTLISGIILFLAGGGIKTKDWSLDTKGLPGIIEAVGDYMDKSQNREMRQQVFDQYKNNLQIKQTDDMLKLLKQFSDNRDSAK